MSSYSDNPDKIKRDTALIARICDKDEKALADLYDHHGCIVHSLVYHIVGNDADAEEITQEAFFKVWQNAGSFNAEKGNPLVWIVTISRRLAIDRLRSKGHKFQQRSSVLDQSLIDELQAEINSVESEVDPAHKKKLDESLKQLTDKHLEVINLAFYDSMSHSMISDHLDIPLGTVKSRIREAMKHLRTIFNRRGIEK